MVTCGTTKGTHHGTFGGLAPTGRSITVPWAMFTTFANGRIIGDSELYDALGMMTQLGAIPSSEQGSHIVNKRTGRVISAGNR